MQWNTYVVWYFGSVQAPAMFVLAKQDV